VSAAAGPFEITSIATQIIAGTAFAVAWDVAGTNLAPINCANVDIDLIDFAPGGGSYSVYPLDTVPNEDGSALVKVESADSQHLNARIRVKCSDNIFYDLSDTDLTVSAVGTPVLMDDTEFTTRTYGNDAITGFSAPACGAVVECEIPDTVDPDPGGSGKGDASALDYRWLLLMGGFLLIARVRRARGAY
jgi:hypothetical protein